MKQVLTILAIIAIVNSVNGQQGLYKRDTTKAKNCFEEYYESFTERGALPVTDGEHRVVYSARKDSICYCGEGKITVKDGNIIPGLLIKKIDGTYEPARKTLHLNTKRGEGITPNMYTAPSGISSSFLTDDFYIVNLFFIDFLKRKVVPDAPAPSPDEISGIQIELNKEEKEIVRKAYEGLQFENGKAAIKPSSYSHLNLLATMMLEKPEYKLNVTGYTDNVGSVESNLTLSKNRAESVKNYLIKQGVDASRITAEGFGIENPIGDNKTSEGRAKNRRVEFVMVN
ncbi:MAG: OmpA family protein [Bacteroidia bacterium]